MSHNHDDRRLTFGCPGCVALVQRDAWTHQLRTMSDDDLLEYIGGRWHREFTDERARLAGAEFDRRFAAFRQMADAGSPE